MKKAIYLTLTLMLLGCLTACGFNVNVNNAVNAKAESAPKVEEMMQALTENRLADAKVLMHPQVAEKSEAALAQVSDYLAGRNADSIEPINVSVKTSTGTSGKARQEQMVYQVALPDGVTVFLNVVYLSNDAGSGFASFQLVLGVV